MQAGQHQQLLLLSYSRLQRVYGLAADAAGAGHITAQLLAGKLIQALPLLCCMAAC
jgi:hypothetical protein